MDDPQTPIAQDEDVSVEPPPETKPVPPPRIAGSQDISHVIGQ